MCCFSNYPPHLVDLERTRPCATTTVLNRGELAAGARATKATRGWQTPSDVLLFELPTAPGRFRSHPAMPPDHGRESWRVGRRSARHQSHARMANSVRCAAFRTTHRTWSILSGEMSAQSHRRNGSRKREVCAV